MTSRSGGCDTDKSWLGEKEAAMGYQPSEEAEGRNMPRFPPVSRTILDNSTFSRDLLINPSSPLLSFEAYRADSIIQILK